MHIVYFPISFSTEAWWRHQMEAFSALLAICAGNSLVPWNSPHKGQWRGALMFSLVSAWINGSVNNREAGDLRRNRAHYDAIVMECPALQNRNQGSGITHQAGSECGILSIAGPNKPCLAHTIDTRRETHFSVLWQAEIFIMWIWGNTFYVDWKQ